VGSPTLKWGANTERFYCYGLKRVGVTETNGLQQLVHAGGGCVSWPMCVCVFVYLLLMDGAAPA
jgi:hypothetical protein